MGMNTPNMLNTDILLQDRGRYSNAFSNLPSLSVDTVSDSITDNFSPESIWSSENSVQNMDLMIDSFNLERLSVPDTNILTEEWESSLKIDDLVLEEKPLLTHFEALKKNNEPTILVMPEPNTSNDTIFDVVRKQTRIPGVDDLSTLQLFEDTEDNFAENDLPINLDLCTFINEDHILSTEPTEDKKTTEVPKVNEPTEDKKANEVPKFKAGRKKIDLKAQRYILENEYEDEDIDVETISEGGNNPVLEAGDLDSLLEQFEAAEVKIEATEVKIEAVEVKIEAAEVEFEDTEVKIEAADVKIEAADVKMEAAEVKIENISTDYSKNLTIPIADEKKSSASSVISEAHISNKNIRHSNNNRKGRLNNSTIKAFQQNDSKSKHVNVPIKNVATSKEQKQSALATVKKPNKQIIEELPKELINRIRESGKRKTKGIAIIDPFPTNGGKKKKVQEVCSVPHTNYSVSQPSKLRTDILNISLDHNYCNLSMPIKNNKKNVASVSTKDQPKSLQNQPVVKNADGKLMISLLKVNTIKSNSEEKKKKKLNIEEYKKRRFGSLIKPQTSSSNSPISSNCSSPLPTEDENTRRMKHEEKLRKMALELLNTPAKSASSASTKPSNLIPVKIEATPPCRDDMDVITCVSIGINTEITGRDPLAPAEKLEEIKPLLKRANVKINSNSFINSLIENIPNVIKPEASIPECDVKGCNREDKTIIYLPKMRILPETKHIGVQTTITLLGNIKTRYRRREDSTSSNSSNDSEIRSNKRRRFRYSRSSRISRSTSISSFSSRSSYRSISRSPSPVSHNRKREYIQEVEERRVIYVGKIAPKTTKEDLYYRFSKFGLIKSISLHFRDHGDNYGFVTFKNKEDAYRAFEHGNDNPCDPQYTLSFGGRRLFCKTNYSDLDKMTDDFDCSNAKSIMNSSGDDSSFDRLLMEMQQTLKKRRL